MENDEDVTLCKICMEPLYGNFFHFSCLEEHADSCDASTEDCDISELEYDEEEDEIQDIKNKQRNPSLDELLEKIKEKGLNSLTEKELSQLNKYSN